MNTAIARTRSDPPRFLPEHRPRARDRLIRAAAGHFLHRAGKFDSPAAAVAASWPHDEATPIITRAAAGVATPTAAGWAAELAHEAVADFIAGLTGLSAAARLLQLGLRLELAGKGALFVPAIATGPGDAGDFVAAGEPIRVVQLTTDHAPLTPARIKSIAVFSIELANATAVSVENVFRQVLNERAAASLDATLFSSTASSSSRPAGLFVGAASVTASTATSTADAMAEDLGALIASVAGIAGSGPVVIVAAPAQAVAIRLRGGTSFAYEVLASSALAAGTVAAIAPNVIVSAFSPVPRFDLADQATLHFEDSSPAPIVSGGSVPSGSVKSLWQSGLVSLRLLLDATWNLRASGGVAVVSGVSW